ncbi:hypothetical protein GCM10010341_79380 [Streptomyces noursei]|nr:hypothetical protein GCM10010341_79380 [Streptomyces noursei]
MGGPEPAELLATSEEFLDQTGHLRGVGISSRGGAQVLSGGPSELESVLDHIHVSRPAGGCPRTRPDRLAADKVDAEWVAVRLLPPVPDWLQGRGGQPEGYCHRQMLDAIRYLVVGGTCWRAMPADFPSGAGP